MTDEPDNRQQNLPDGKKRPPTAGSFKPGFDRRRWLKGRGAKSPEQREGDEILRAVIWEELSREFDMATMKPTETADTVDALRLMVRTWIKKNPAAVAERIAGKVTEKIDVKTDAKVIFEVIRKDAKISNPAANPPRETGSVPGQSSEAQGDRSGTARRQDNGS